MYFVAVSVMRSTLLGTFDRLHAALVYKVAAECHAPHPHPESITIIALSYHSTNLLSKDGTRAFVALHLLRPA